MEVVWVRQFAPFLGTYNEKKRVPMMGRSAGVSPVLWRRLEGLRHTRDDVGG